MPSAQLSELIFQPRLVGPADDTRGPATLPADGFRIRWSAGTDPLVESRSEAAAAYAARVIDALRQTAFPKGGWHIVDWPDFERRGFMLDISRNRVPRMDWLLRLVEQLAALRYNELQLYTEHTFQYRDHACVWANASPVTADDIRELAAACRRHHIDLVPNQNSFGHMERWLKHRAYAELAECPEGFIHPVSGERRGPSTLHPCDASVALVRSLFTELVPHFASPYLHIGGDEPWELGRGRSAARVAAEGKQSVYLDYLNQLFDAAGQLGRTPQFWADVILEDPKAARALPDHVIPVIWGYEANSPFAAQCQRIRDAGFDKQYYVAPGCGNWNSFGGRFELALQNIDLAAKEGKRHGAKGLLLTSWGDNGHFQPACSAYPGIVMAAHAAWDGNLPHDLPATIDRLFYPGHPGGSGAAILEMGRCEGLLPQPAPPNSFLHSALFAAPDRLRELLSSVPGKGAFKRIENRLRAIGVEAFPADVQLTHLWMTSALQRCMGESRVDPHALVRRFTDEWLATSRQGGLEDNLRRLRETLGINPEATA